MTTYCTPVEALQAAQTEGWVAIAAGVYLNSRASIIEEQSEWIDEDDAKNIDFKRAPFWLTTNCGAVPQPIYGEEDEDLIEILTNA